MAISVSIDGASVTPLQGSLDIEASYGSAHICRLDIEDQNATMTFEHDDEISVLDSTTLIFGGLVDDPSIVGLYGEALTARIHQLTCVDYRARCDQRVIDKSYSSGQTVKQILSDLRTDYLDVFGITLDTGQADGPALDAPADWQNITLREALDDLTQRTGWPWTISYAKVLGAYDPDSAPAAPFSITSSSRNAQRVSVGRPRTDQRNTEILLYGSPGTQLVTDSWVSTLGQTSFVLHYTGITSWQHMTRVGFGPYPVGTYGVDAMEWTYDSATNALIRVTPSLAGETIQFHVWAPFPQRVTVQSTDSTSNPRERVDSAPDVYDYPQALEIAEGLYRRYASTSVPRQVSVETQTAGLQPGQKLPITLSAYGLSTDYFVTSVRTRHMVDTKERLQYDVECVEGTEIPESFQESWRAMSGGGGAGIAVASVPTGGSTAVAEVSVLPAFIGGSQSEFRCSTAWTPAPQAQTFRAPTDATYSVRLDRMTDSTGTTVQVRLFDITSTGATVTGAATASTAWEEETLTAALTGGHRYRVELIASSSQTNVRVGQAIVEI